MEGRWRAKAVYIAATIQTPHPQHLTLQLRGKAGCSKTPCTSPCARAGTRRKADIKKRHRRKGVEAFSSSASKPPRAKISSLHPADPRFLLTHPTQPYTTTLCIHDATGTKSDTHSPQTSPLSPKLPTYSICATTPPTGPHPPLCAINEMLSMLKDRQLMLSTDPDRRRDPRRLRRHPARAQRRSWRCPYCP